MALCIHKHLFFVLAIFLILGPKASLGQNNYPPATIESSQSTPYPYGTQIAYGVAGLTGGFLIGVTGTLITALSGGIAPVSSADLLLAGGAAGAVVGATYMVHYSGQRHGYDGRFWPLAGGALIGSGISLTGGLLITPAVFWVTFPVLTLTGAIVGYKMSAKPHSPTPKTGTIHWQFLQERDKLVQSINKEADMRYSIKATRFY